jgi:hypothetical protein
MPEEGALPGYSQAATYLLHLIERGLVDAHLLKVILRGLDHLIDDLAVDIALDVPSALPWPCCWRARGLLTTITFDMAARFPTPSYLLYGCNVRRHGAGARLSLARRGWERRQASQATALEAADCGRARSQGGSRAVGSGLHARDSQTAGLCTTVAGSARWCRGV